MTLRILLAESDTEDVLFLRDVLEEMEGSGHWSGWRHLDTLDAPTWNFAEAILATEPIDVILLSLELTDVQGRDAFRRAQAAAPQVPVVLLVNEENVDLAGQLVREGAQDFLVKKTVDLEPMAHALSNAIARHRLVAAAHAASMTDPLTGLLNRAGFQMLAERDRRIAERSGGRMAVLIAEPRNFAALTSTYGAQRRDLALVEATDQLRAVATPTDVVARIGEDSFGICLVDTREEPLQLACNRFLRSNNLRSLSIGAAFFDPSGPRSLEKLLEAAESELTPAAAVASFRA